MPTPPSTTRLKAPERRTRILAAAIELMAQRGYDRISVSEIAEAAGCSKAVLYDHFTSKGDIAVAAVEDANLRLLGHIAGRVASVGDASTRVRFETALNAFFEFVERNRAASRALFRDPSADPVVFEAHSRVKHTAALGVAAMLADGVEPQPGDTDLDRMLELFGEILTSSLAGLARWWEQHPDVEREVLVKSVLAFGFLGLDRLAQGERLDMPPS